MKKILFLLGICFINVNGAFAAESNEKAYCPSIETILEAKEKANNISPFIPFIVKDQDLNFRVSVDSNPSDNPNISALRFVKGTERSDKKFFYTCHYEHGGEKFTAAILLPNRKCSIVDPGLGMSDGTAKLRESYARKRPQNVQFVSHKIYRCNHPAQCPVECHVDLPNTLNPYDTKDSKDFQKNFENNSKYQENNPKYKAWEGDVDFYFSK